jgi:hypothetical protein
LKFLRFLPDKERLRVIALLAILYAYASFAYSFIGFIHMQPGIHYHEYIPSKLAVEVLGHFFFGFVAALPLLDLSLAFLTGALAVLIDTDHLLGAWGFSVSGRPDHSFFYAMVSTVILVVISRKVGMRSPTLAKIAFVGTITLFSHIAYDIFAGTGSDFPLFIPFNFANTLLLGIDWVVFEIAAVFVAALGWFVSRRIKKIGVAIEKSKPSDISSC